MTLCVFILGVVGFLAYVNRQLDIIRTRLGVHDVWSRISVSVELFLRIIIAMLQHVHLHNQSCLNESINKQTQELDDQRRYPLRIRKNTDFYGDAIKFLITWYTKAI